MAPEQSLQSYIVAETVFDLITDSSEVQRRRLVLGRDVRRKIISLPILGLLPIFRRAIDKDVYFWPAAFNQITSRVNAESATKKKRWREVFLASERGGLGPFISILSDCVTKHSLLSYIAYLTKLDRSNASLSRNATKKGPKNRSWHAKPKKLCKRRREKDWQERAKTQPAHEIEKSCERRSLTLFIKVFRLSLVRKIIEKHLYLFCHSLLALLVYGISTELWKPRLLRWIIQRDELFSLTTVTNQSSAINFPADDHVKTLVSSLFVDPHSSSRTRSPIERFPVSQVLPHHETSHTAYVCFRLPFLTKFRCSIAERKQKKEKFSLSSHCLLVRLGLVVCCSLRKNIFCRLFSLPLCEGLSARQKANMNGSTCKKNGNDVERVLPFSPQRLS